MLSCNDSQLRTHVLSNGEVIWDIAGNVWEMADAQCGATSWYNGAAWYEWDNANLTDYEQIVGGSTTSTSTNGVGNYSGCTTNTNVFLRGGYWPEGVNTGIFAMNYFLRPHSVINKSPKSKIIKVCINLFNRAII